MLLKHGMRARQRREPDGLRRCLARDPASAREAASLDDTHLHWVAELGGTRHKWDAEITEQKPDERVAWRNTDGKENAGVVTFHRLDDSRTRIMVQLDLRRFNEMIEARGAVTGGWRGEVKRPDEA